MRIALLDDYQGVALKMADWSPLHAHAIAVFCDHTEEENALVARLHDFDIVVAMRERTPFPRPLLERLPKLRLLVTTGRRNASIDMSAATRLGIVVSGTRGSGTSTGELTWGLILALLRNIPLEDRAVREGQWQRTVGVGLEGKTLGVIGLGNIGAQVARVGQAFRLRVVAWSQNLTAARAAEGGATLVSKEELLRTSDIVTIHLVLSPRTRGLIGAGELALMKPTAFLVNTSRGPIVDEDALARALNQGAIAGAALDVFDREPLPPGHSLLTAPNTVLTPHIGYVVRENYQTYFADVIENIQSLLSGSPVRVINTEVLESPARRR